MFEKYNESWNKESNLGIKDNPDIERYWDYLNRILTTNPEFEIMFSYPKINLFKRLMRKIIYSKIFEYFIITIIILNLIVMSISYDGSSEIYNYNLDILNSIFTFIYILKLLLKFSVVVFMDIFILYGIDMIF